MPESDGSLFHAKRQPHALFAAHAHHLFHHAARLIELLEQQVYILHRRAAASPTTFNCWMAAGRYTSQATSRGFLPCRLNI